MYYLLSAACCSYFTIFLGRGLFFYRHHVIKASIGLGLLNIILYLFSKSVIQTLSPVHAVTFWLNLAMSLHFIYHLKDYRWRLDDLDYFLFNLLIYLFSLLTFIFSTINIFEYFGIFDRLNIQL